MSDDTRATTGEGALAKLEDIKASPGGIIVQRASDVWSMANIIAKSGLAPYGLETPQKVFVAIQMGAEIGLKPMTSLRNIAVINGRPAVWGDVPLALAELSGKLEDIQETFDDATMTATCRILRAGRKTYTERSFSKADAEVAGLWGRTGRNGQPTPWITYPKRMLQMRARGFCIRDTFPDFLGGFTLAEEAQDMPEADAEAEFASRSEELEARLKEREEERLAADAEAMDAEFTPVEPESTPEPEAPKASRKRRPKQELDIDEVGDDGLSERDKREAVEAEQAAEAQTASLFDPDAR